jgi:hypothetical protein
MVCVSSIVVEEEAQALHLVLAHFVEDFGLVGVFGFFEEAPPLGPGLLGGAQGSALARGGMTGFTAGLENLFADLDVDRGSGRAESERKEQEREKEEAEETGHCRAPFAKNEKHRQATFFNDSKDHALILRFKMVSSVAQRMPGKWGHANSGGSVAAVGDGGNSAKMLNACRDFADVDIRLAPVERLTICNPGEKGG